MTAALALPPLGGCSNNGSSAEPPSGFTATAGDGRVVVTWAGSPDVDYWLFTATDPSLTAFNWTGLPNSHAYPSAPMPFYMCGLLDGTQYWFAANGRTSGGPGGPSSATVSATPYQAGSVWTTNAPLIQTLFSPDLYGVGYAGLTTCSNITTSAAGSFAAVGAGGAIFTSADGTNWMSQNAPAGFTSDLYAVTGYAAYQNSPSNPGLRWVAVGAGGASIYSTDGVVWAAGRAYDVNNPALRSLTHAGGTFYAVGDLGTIMVSTDGISWSTPTSGTTNNLNGVTYGSAGYAAVGDSGTILTSADGATWITRISGMTGSLRQVSSIGSTFVAVGDNGAVSTSIDGGVTWATQTIAGEPNLVGVAANAQLAAHNSNGYLFSSTDLATNSLFVAIDSNGNAYTSTDGVNWPTPIATGISNLSNLGQSLVSSGFGYVAVAAAGITATSF